MEGGAKGCEVCLRITSLKDVLSQGLLYELMKLSLDR